MEIRLGWNELEELVQWRRAEKDGVTLTLDPPRGTIVINRPANPDWKAPPVRDPHVEDMRLILNVVSSVLEGLDPARLLTTAEIAKLRLLAGEMEEMLRADGD